MNVWACVAVMPLHVPSSQFKGNNARNGGGASIQSYAEVTITGCSFENNMAARKADSATSCGKDGSGAGGALCLDMVPVSAALSMVARWPSVTTYVASQLGWQASIKLAHALSCCSTPFFVLVARTGERCDSGAGFSVQRGKHPICTHYQLHI